MLKTLWTGVDGWADQQVADGTVIWTAPTGKTHKTMPGSRIFFPAWNTTTADIPNKPPGAAVTNRGVMMPKRRRTRAADRAQRIKKQRALNAALNAEWAARTAEAAPARNKPPPEKPDEVVSDDDPPPF